MKTIRKSRCRSSAAFSLMETLVATGVIATALMGSMGMMAMGLGQSRESIERSRAAMLARKVFADFHAGSPLSKPANEDVRYTKTLLPLGDVTFEEQVLVFDENFKYLTTSTGEASYSQGATDQGAAFIVRIEGNEKTALALDAPSKPVSASIDIDYIRKNYKALGGKAYSFDSVPADKLVAVPPPVEMSRVTLSVEAPASVPAPSRKTYRYEFLRQF